MAEKLKTIARSCQVISVTHAPVIAAFADQHLKISKEEKEGRTFTVIRKLTGDQVVLELSRMLTGDQVSEVTLSQAKELLKMGNDGNDMLQI
ncbi:hypothetical protein [Dehalobacterium formicoaceticum]|uniref:hypothetical protein n=1 Tax=Dehalobacterium formicoaceticum TaxID=51515 RepID=UPI000B7C7852|nr:hypothetical protein [Dehalobacterium formicoaceticum]